MIPEEIERNADVLLNACKNIGLAVNTCKTNYMEIGRQRGMNANGHIRIGSHSRSGQHIESPSRCLRARQVLGTENMVVLIDPESSLICNTMRKQLQI